MPLDDFRWLKINFLTLRKVSTHFYFAQRDPSYHLYFISWSYVDYFLIKASIMTILQFFSKNRLDLSPFCPPFCETPKNPDFQTSRPTREKSKSRIKKSKGTLRGGPSMLYTKQKKLDSYLQPLTFQS